MIENFKLEIINSEFTAYKNELKALKKSQRFRERKLFSSTLLDFASNDYLGLAENKKLLKKAFKTLLKQKSHSPKASMLVNGYSKIHQQFEKYIAKRNGFEKAIVVGSGFLANISLFEALIRKNDFLFVDESYHASGILATKLIENRVIFFKHNNFFDLQSKISQIKPTNRIFIAIEGVYSMSGNLANVDIIHFANQNNFGLIIDEAHSSGVLGKNLNGILDFYNIEISKNIIKLGTLGKAYGSYGAYICANNEIISFLENRAKPIIYSTAPSLFDIALAFENAKYIHKNSKKISQKIEKILNLINSILNTNHKSLIIPIELNSNEQAVTIQQKLVKLGFLVGAIRQPTVEIPILRVIARINLDLKDVERIFKEIKKLI